MLRKGAPEPAKPVAILSLAVFQLLDFGVLLLAKQSTCVKKAKLVKANQKQLECRKEEQSTQKDFGGFFGGFFFFFYSSVVKSVGHDFSFQ